MWVLMLLLLLINSDKQSQWRQGLICPSHSRQCAKTCNASHGLYHMHTLPVAMARPLGSDGHSRLFPSNLLSSPGEALEAEHYSPSGGWGYSAKSRSLDAFRHNSYKYCPQTLGPDFIPLGQTIKTNFSSGGWTIFKGLSKGYGIFLFNHGESNQMESKSKV